MGDYTKKDVKIGTCGRGYYTTKQMLESYLKKEADPEVSYYLKPSNGCSFAFPFPEYDGKELGTISNFHEDKRVDYRLTFTGDKNKVHHKNKLYYHLHPKGGEGVNVSCECPYLTHPNLNNNKTIFRLTEQIYIDNTLHVAGVCIYCGTENIFELEEVQLMVSDIEHNITNKRQSLARQYSSGLISKEMLEKEYKQIEYDIEICKRMLATYIDNTKISE